MGGLHRPVSQSLIASCQWYFFMNSEYVPIQAIVSTLTSSRWGLIKRGQGHLASVSGMWRICFSPRGCPASASGCECMLRYRMIWVGWMESIVNRSWSSRIYAIVRIPICCSAVRVHVRSDVHGPARLKSPGLGSARDGSGLL